MAADLVLPHYYASGVNLLAPRGLAVPTTGASCAAGRSA